MVQDQLVEYINSQMKLGVSRDAIKTSLTGAGWVAADVEDTLKKVESAKTSQPMSAGVKPAQGASEPQTIKVSDLISSSPMASSSPATAAAASSSPKSPLTGPMPTGAGASSGTKAGDTFQASSYPGMKPRASRGALITEIALAAAVVAVGGFAGFLYMQNNGLNTQLSALNGQSSAVTSQLSTLQAQVAASTTALTAQVSSLTGESKELQAELSFYAKPSSTAPAATSTATISGTVSGGEKTSYVITAMYGAKVSVANSKVSAVIAALSPLMATASTTAATAQFTGTYVPGSGAITLTGVNGTSLQ